MSRIWSLLLLGATLHGCSGPQEPITDATDDPIPVCPEFVLAAGGLPDTGEWRTHPAIGDVDGDGLGDIAALARKASGPRVFLSDGLGNWTEASEGLEYDKSFSCGVGTRLVDLNRDGLLDLVVADHCTGVSVYRGDGGQVWKKASLGIPRNLEGFNDADAGDLDGDGILDIVAVSAFSRGFLVLKGQPDGTWKVRRDTGLPQTGAGWQLMLTDMNGDRLLDVVCTFNPVTTDRRNAPPPPAKVWLQDASGKFRPAAGFPHEGRFFGVATWPRPGRATPDLVFALSGYHAGLHLYESSSGDSWTEVGRIDEPWFVDRQPGFAGVRILDLNGDGCMDLLANEGSTQRVLLALGDCEGSWHLCPEETFPLVNPVGFGWGLAAGDLNGDGRADVVSGYGTKDGGLKAWFQVDPASAVVAASRAQGQGLSASSPARGSGVDPTP